MDRLYCADNDNVLDRFVRTTSNQQAARRSLAAIHSLAPSAPIERNPTRQALNHLAYWVIYPLTLLECALMACISLFSFMLWRISYFALGKFKKAMRPAGQVGKGQIDSENALGVMRTIERIARDCGAAPFWISGTLLGMERLGRPLPHDNDMDLGINTTDPHHLDFLRALSTSSEVTTIAPQGLSVKAWVQNPDLHVVPGRVLRYKSFVRNEHAPHLPPVKVDLFLHFQYCGGSMHGSRNTLWWNSDFNVIQKAYGTNSFSVPADTHLHLTENYGDYTTESKDFENCIDCPNAMSIFSWESLAYLLVRQKAMLKRGRVLGAQRVNGRIGQTIFKGMVPLYLRKNVTLGRNSLNRHATGSTK